MDDDRTVHAALRAAAGDLSAPAGLLDDVRRGGRRRIRRRRLAATAGAACVVLLIASAAYGYSGLRDRGAPPADRESARPPDATATASQGPTPPTGCAVERLPVPGGHRQSVVTGADPSGRYVLGRSYPAGGGQRRQVIVWDNGSPRNVDVPGVDQALNDINGSGVAVGTSFVGDAQRGWLYRDGRVTALRGPATAGAVAVGETGILVGGREVSAGRNVPMIWRTPDSEPVDLPVPAGWSGSAVQVADDGTVVGMLSKTPQGPFTAYLWAPDGTGRPLAVTPPTGGRNAVLVPISIAGRYVTGLIEYEFGVVGAESTAFQPVNYDLETGLSTNIAKVGAQVVSPVGWGVVGKALTTPGPDGSTPPQRQLSLVTGAGEVPLPPLHTLDHLANIATTISADGRIIGGQSNDASGQSQAVLWRCR